VDVEVSVLGKVWVEGNSVEALLDEAGLHIVTKRVDAGEIKERILVHTAISIYDLDAACALDHEDATGTITGIGDVDRIKKAVCNFDQRDFGIARKITAGLGYLIGT